MNNLGLGQYYTNNNISKLLVSQIDLRNPNAILELGIGEGGLISEAKKKWYDSQIIGADIDEKNISFIKDKYPDIEVFLLNGLHENINLKLNRGIGSIDVALCNPPYVPIKKNKEIASILIQSRLGNILNYSVVTSDLIFLAQNLLMIRENGFIGIILPDRLVSSSQFTYFRDNLLKNYYLKSCIELPSNIFKKTEAKTHILIIQKSTNFSRKKTSVCLSNRDGQIVKQYKIQSSKLIERMDFNYINWKSKNKRKGLSLDELGVTVYRGKYSKKELENYSQEFIHTSALKENLNFQKFSINTDGRFTDVLKAEKDDVIIARVGKKCLGKVLIVEEGLVLVSDCVFLLKIPALYRLQIINSLNSEYGRLWVNAHATGVCTRSLSKSNLLNFIP